MGEQDENQCCQNGNEEEHRHRQDEKILQFLDSMDSYLTLMDSLSSILRQGWLELASARHSMGASRISSALFDHKLHSAATTLQMSEDSEQDDPIETQPQFTLCKWASYGDGKCFSTEEKIDGYEVQKKSNSPQLRHRGSLKSSEPQEEQHVGNGAFSTVDDQVQKERSKSLAVFGALVSPKLRCAQVSFETALETIVEVANKRSLMLSGFAQVQQEMESSME